MERAPVNDEVANRMSLFFAYPNPFTKALIDQFCDPKAEDVAPKAHLTRCFALIANGCKVRCLLCSLFSSSCSFALSSVLCWSHHSR